MKKGILADLFATFAKIGLFTFGGGYAMISFIREQALLYGWLTESELLISGSAYGNLEIMGYSACESCKPSRASQENTFSQCSRRDAPFAAHERTTA